ncbi:MAG: ABC transporter substrate-binding protein [Mangrovicoccus sp.]|nr:ABC transporter substrate-binding protein [Mangrovicoccus sp.]
MAIPVIYLHQEQPAPPVLSNLDPIPADRGMAGAQLGLADNLTTGSFMGHAYSLEVITVPEGGDFLASAKSALSQSALVIADAPASALLALADLPEAQEALIFNTSAPDGALRGADCRANLLHTLPSHAMRADALMQFMQKKRWDDLVMVAGTRQGDQAFASALEGSAAKFGLKVRARKDWAFDADMRRNAGQELPLFTQELGRYDVLLVADEADDFARYIAFNTWKARPVAGSDGLVPATWAPVVEQWGAAQLQSRFHDQAERSMNSRDYAAWAAMRAIGEAVTRTGSNEAATLRDFLLSDQFQLAGFKGRPLSFRDWNGQMRQPIPLVTPRALVAQAPLEGFLHPVSELDTLGADRPETTCTAFAQ